MRYKIKYLLVSMLMLLSLSAKAQQDPQYTQYMYNMSVINPAYSTDDTNLINLGGLYRAQWVGSVGGPTTGTFFAHSPITQNQEIGFSMVHDQIGDIAKESNVFIDYSYKIKTGETSKMAFGLKAGASFFSTEFDGLKFTDATPDPAFANNISRVFPNIGVGTYFYGNNYYLGLSSPNMLQSKQLKNQDGIIETGVEEIHAYFTGGYVFNLGENYKLKPAFMTKVVKGAPLSLDLTTNLLMFNRLELGTAYRWNESVSALANVLITPNLRIGYAYDYTLNNLGSFNRGSHEIMLLFNISKSKLQSEYENGYDKSPRFF